MVQAALAAAMMNDDMGACTPKSGWLYSLEFIALLRLQECIAEQASEREGKTQSCGRWSFRFSNQLHGRNTLRSGCRTRERTGRAAAAEIKGGPSNAPCTALPTAHTHSRDTSLESERAIQYPQRANGYATIRCGGTAVQRIMQTSAEGWPRPASQSACLEGS